MEKQDNKEKIELYKSISKLKMGLKGVDKTLEGYGYQYQDFNEILKEIKSVIRKNKIDIDFTQKITYKIILDSLVRVIETTFFSPTTGYEISFDFPILKEDLAITTKSLSNLTPPQVLGCVITYFKRYSLVSFLSIESEIDNDVSFNEVQTDNKEKQTKQTKNNAHNFNNKTFDNLITCVKKIKEKGIEGLEYLDNLINITKNGNGKEILNYFHQNPKMKTVDFWENVLIQYFTNLSVDGILDQFCDFMETKQTEINSKPSIMFTLLLNDKYFNKIFTSK